jgi:transcriptional regulator with XRE-family HTH domain
MGDDNAQREIVTRVREAIHRAGLSHTEVARRLGWPQQRLARRLTSADYAASFSAAELVEVARVLDIPAADLLPRSAPEPAGDLR